MNNTDNQAKQAARDQLAKDVAEFERKNGPIQTQPISRVVGKVDQRENRRQFTLMSFK